MASLSGLCPPAGPRARLGRHGCGPALSQRRGSHDMTDKRRAIHPGASRSLAWILILLTGALLQGCGQNAGPGGSRLRFFAADLTGAAKSCEVPKVTPAAGQ